MAAFSAGTRYVLVLEARGVVTGTLAVSDGGDAATAGVGLWLDDATVEWSAGQEKALGTTFVPWSSVLLVREASENA